MCGWAYGATQLTLKIVSDNVLKSLPAIVMLRTFRGKEPNISLLKSDVRMVIGLASAA